MAGLILLVSRWIRRIAIISLLVAIGQVNSLAHPVHDDRAAIIDEDCGPHEVPNTPPEIPLGAGDVLLLDRVDSSGETTAIAAVAGQVHRVVVRPNEVLYRRFITPGGWQAETMLAVGARYSEAAVAAVSATKTWAFWIELNPAGQSEIYARKIISGIPSGSAINVSSTVGQDRQLSVATDGQNVWLVWIHDSDQADVYLRKLDANDVLPPIVNVSQTVSNDWHPAIALGSNGEVHLAWDSYLADNYDVFYRSYNSTTGLLGTLRAIATGPNFQAHPSIATDEQNRVWIAWEEAQANWGLGDRGQNRADWDATLATLNVLHGNRTAKLAIYRPSDNALLTPSISLESRIASYMNTTNGQDYPLRDMPTLHRFSGRTWLVFRYAPFNTDAARWNVFCTAIDDARWYSIEKIGNSGGYLFQRTSLVNDGTSLWMSGGLVGNSTTGTCYAGRLPANTLVQNPTITWTTSATPAVPAVVTRTQASHQINVDGVPYTTMWGDLHRHTELSADSRWGADGTIEELYRYAMDAAKLQFIAQTDHGSSYMSRHYPRVLMESDSHVSSSFAPLYGYEFTAHVIGGVAHHNVISRQTTSFPGDFDSSIAETSSLGNLFNALIPGNSIAIPHTTAKTAGGADALSDLNDWAALKLIGLANPAFYRVVEIYQAARTSYEYAGAPAPFGTAPTNHLTAGTIRTMLAQDVRMGFIASSDHRSNFYSFAVAYADALSRESIFDALHARRCYASSSRDIALEFWVNNRPMGEEINAGSPTATIRAFASAPSAISTVTVLRDGFDWQTSSPNTSVFNGAWTDPDACGHYYYVRIKLANGHMAWSSPIWVECVDCTTNAECQDGLFCNGAEICSNGSCLAGSNPCPGQSCIEATNQCVGCLTNADCNDGLYCNGVEVCAAGVCQPGSPINCVDAFACTADSCSEASDACLHAPNNALCNNGLFCDGSESCAIGVGCQSGAPPCGASECDEATDSCASSGQIWMAFPSATTVPGVGTVQNEDIVSYDLGAGTWTLMFDGSDVGLSSFAIDGLARLPAGDLLLSFTLAGGVAGMTGGPSATSLDDSDIVRFFPSSLGSTTTGSFTFYFDGSDVGLTTDDEDVDAIGLAPDGRLLISTLGQFTVTGASGNDEDLVIFNATSLGAATVGSFSMYFDGSDVELANSNNEDVDAAAIMPNGDVLLSTFAAFSVSGASAGGADVLEFSPTSTGSNTAGIYSIFLTPSSIGLTASANVTALEIVP